MVPCSNPVQVIDRLVWISPFLLRFCAFLFPKRYGLECELALLEIHLHKAVFRNRAGKNLSRQRGLQMALQKTLQWSRAVDEIITLPGDVLLCCFCQFQFEVPIT